MEQGAFRGSGSRRHIPSADQKSIFQELKDLANILYKDIVVMIEFVETDYHSLTLPDVRVFRRFLFFKQEVY